MKGVEIKSLSLGEDSQISPKFSICLAENVEGFQQCVKEILKLIEQDGNSSEMTTHVAELSRMHGVLVDQHVSLIGEVNKNCAPLIKRQYLDSYDSRSPQVTQMFTPDHMSNTHKLRSPIGFDALLSSGGGGGGGTGSYASRIDGSESSFSLSSDSDSESFISINKLLISPVNDDALKVKETKVSEVLLNKISNLEEEVVTLNTKIQSLADENTDLKDAISDSNLNVKSMGDELEASREKLLAAEDEVSKLKHELSIKMSKLGSTQQEMALLQKHFDFEKECNQRLEEEISLCVADISVRNDQISLMKSTHEAKEAIWNTDIGKLKMEVSEKCQSVNDLNKSLDFLKLQKDGVTAQLDTLRAEKCSQDNLVKELETCLNSIQVEHAGVLLSFDNAQKVIDGLKEEKREVIRQLSFSLDHYMSRYKQLRQAFVGKKETCFFDFLS